MVMHDVYFSPASGAAVKYELHLREIENRKVFLHLTMFSVVFFFFVNLAPLKFSNRGAIFNLFLSSKMFS